MKRIFSIKYVSAILTTALLVGCAYYNTMFNAFKMYEEGNLKLANSKDGKITTDVRRNFNSAIDKCWTLINVHGDSSDWADDALLLIGKSHYLMKEYSKSERFLDQFLKKYPKSDLYNEASIWYAKVLVENNNEELALKMLNKILLNEMDDALKAEALSSIGSIFYLRQDYKEAIKKFKECIEISDDDLLSASCQFKIGEIYFELEQYVDAIENFNAVLNYDAPEEVEFNALMLKVDAQIELSKYDLALKTLSQMLRNSKIKNKYSQVEAKMGDIYILQEKNEYATEHYFDVIDRYPKSLGSAWSFFKLAELLENYYFDTDSAKNMYLKVKQESNQSEFIDEAARRSNILKKYLDFRDKITQNRQDILEYTSKLSDTTNHDSTMIDSLDLVMTKSDSDSVGNQIQKDSQETIQKKLTDTKLSLAKNQYNLAEFFLLNMQNYDSAAASYINFINSGIDSSRIPKAYHAISYIYKYKLDDSTKADSIDKIILSRYPDSPYSEFILSQDIEDDKTIESEDNPMKNKYLIAEENLFDQNYSEAINNFKFIATNDSGNNWGGKARFAISWIYENKLKDINKAIESYTILAKEYPNTEYANIAKHKIKEPKVEEVVDSTNSDSMKQNKKENQNDNATQIKGDETIEDPEENTIKSDQGREGERPLPMPIGKYYRNTLDCMFLNEKGYIWIISMA